MTDPEEFAPDQEIEVKVRSAFQIQDPDQLFVDRLQKKLADRFEDIERSSESKNILSRWSRWLERSKLLLSPLAWGVIAFIFILFLLWGIKTLIPKVEPAGDIQPSPSPIISPSAPKEPTQAEGTDATINLPVLVGMPVPMPEEAINTTNANNITQLASWGGEPIYSVTWAPDGKSFAVASSIGIQIYDSVTFQEIQSIANGSGSYSIAYSPDGTKLASGFNETSVVIWDVASGSALQTLEGHQNFITGLAFSPDGAILATGAYEEPIILWDSASGQELRTLGESAGYAFVFSPDGSRIATVIGDKVIKLWDIASGEALRTIAGHTEYISGMTFSPDGNRLASWSNGLNDKTIKLWDVSTGDEQRTLNWQGNHLNNVTFLPDGNTMVSSAEGEPITVWDISSGQVLRTLSDAIQGGYIAISPDGKIVLFYQWQGNEIKLFDITSGVELRKLDRQSYIVTSVSVSPDGSTVAAGLLSKAIKLLDATNGQELRTLTGSPAEATSLAFSPDGTMLASGSSENKLWDVTSGVELYSSTDTVRTGWIGGIPSVAFSPDGSILAYAASSGRVILWDVINQLEQRVLERESGDEYGEEITSIAFSPDGRTLASGHAYGSIILWDTTSGQELHALTGHTSRVINHWVSALTFSSDGEILVSGSNDREVKLWDVASGSEIKTLTLNEEISSLVFSPKGDVLAVGSGFGSITLLDVVSNERLITLPSPASALAFSPDGKLLISGSSDGFIRLWGIPPLNANPSEAIPLQAEVEIVSITTPAPQATPEDIGMQKIPIPILLTGENLQPGMWSLDGRYYYYADQGPIGEPGPDQAYTTLYFLNSLTGETCLGIQETVTFSQTEWGAYPDGISLYERTTWLDNNHLLYVSPDGELLDLSPCSDAADDWTASLPDRISSLINGPIDGSQILLMGEQAYWLFTPSTRQSLKLDLPAPEESKDIGFAWSPWELKLISSRLEDRQEGLWIILESIDPVTGSASLITEIQASPQLQYSSPMGAGIEWTSKDSILVYDTITGMRQYNLSSQPPQFTNLFPDLFGIEYPGMDQVSAWGKMAGTEDGDYHFILETGMAADGQYYIYHPESGVVDQYPLDPPLLVVFPSGEGGIAQSMDSPLSNITFKVILVDSGTEPYNLVAKGHTPGQNSWSFATILPGSQKIMFSSIQGISLMDLKSGEILQFWGLENQQEVQDIYVMLSPDGKTMVAFSSQKEPGDYNARAMYWLRLEP